MSIADLDIASEYTVSNEPYNGITEIAKLLKERTNSNWLQSHLIMLAVDFRIPVQSLPIWHNLEIAKMISDTIEEVKYFMRENKINVQLTSMSSLILSSWDLDSFNRDMYEVINSLLSRIVASNPIPYSITVVEQMNYLLEIICLHLYGKDYSPVNINLISNSYVQPYLKILNKNKEIFNSPKYNSELLGIVCKYIKDELF